MIKDGTQASYPFRQHFDYSVSAAKNYITLFPQIPCPSEEQHSMLAAAHYTLALQQDLSLSHFKMHTNAVITLLQKVKRRNPALNSMMANAYFKRAELCERENAFKAAGRDYQKTLEVFAHQRDSATLSEEDKLLLAQSALSLADLILHQEPDLQPMQTHHPLFYVNKALEFLSELPKTEEDIWTTFAYAHQIAGLALSNIDINDAKEAFRTAITTAFKTEPQTACHILGDIYNSLGLLYEQQFSQSPIQNVPMEINDQAMVYFSIALFFNNEDIIHFESQEQDFSALDTLFDTIYRSLDPFLVPLSSTVLRDFIDALIYIYYCVSDKILPNQTLQQQLSEIDTFNTFAQHIFWIVSDLHRREHHQENLLEIIRPYDYDIALNLTASLASLLSDNKNKVYYLETDNLSFSM